MQSNIFEKRELSRGIDLKLKRQSVHIYRESLAQVILWTDLSPGSSRARKQHDLGLLLSLCQIYGVGMILLIGEFQVNYLV